MSTSQSTSILIAVIPLTGRSSLRRACAHAVVFLTLAIAACGGGSSGTPGTTVSAASVPVITVQPGDASVVVGASASFTVTATGNGLAYQWQGSSDAGSTWADIADATGRTYGTGPTTTAQSGMQFRVVITGSATLVSSAVTLTVTSAIAAPVISVDVAAVSVAAGADAVFNVTATGSSLSYQWQLSTDGGTTFADIGGATGATLRLPAVGTADSGQRVRVVVSNSAGSVASGVALLTVTASAGAAPAITTQPLAANVTAPAPASFSVIATGTPAPSYQWQKSSDNGATWADIDGATGASFATAATSLADNGSLFRVQLINTAGTATSATARLNVNSSATAPTISSQPAAASVAAPATATFSVTADGSPTPTYQWQLSTDGGTTFANISGATAASYTTPATSSGDMGKQFRVVVSNSAGSVTSTAAGLSVAATPIGTGASQCLDLGIINPGFTAHVVDSLGNVLDEQVNGPSTFQGHTATEIQLTINIVLNGGSLSTVAKAYASFDSATRLITAYGSTSHDTNTVGGQSLTADQTSVYTPPDVNAQFTLAPGQTLTQTSTLVDSGTSTVGGVTQPTPTRTTTETDTVSFVGIETVTVPAGTYQTCRFDHARTTSGSSGTPAVSTEWLRVGDGVSVQTASVVGGASTVGSRVVQVRTQGGPYSPN